MMNCRWRNRPTSNEEKLDENLPLTPDEVEEQRARTMDKALHYLGFKARSEAQMEQYLFSKGFHEEAVETVMFQLKEYGYIDDERMAENLMESSKKQRREGHRKTQQRLMRSGIASDISEKVASDIDEEVELQNAQHWAQRWLPKLTGEAQQRKQKLYRRLLGKGFSYGVVSCVVRKISWSDDDGDEWID